jgi:transposase
MEFKKSLGLVRGKDDHVDAKRIAEYGWLRREILVADVFPGDIIMKLRQIISLRAKLVQDRAGYISRLKEGLATGSIKLNDEEARMEKRIINFLTDQIVKLEAEIKAVIDLDPAVKKNHELLTSIKGVGLIVAAYMIAFTDNFTKFKNARKFNCYAGLAPFKNESGSSKKGKSRVSNLACRQAKTLLDRAACCALRYDKEIAAYYKRKTSEGKPKRSCINAIKGKIVARIFAVVKRQTPFVEFGIAA